MKINEFEMSRWELAELSIKDISSLQQDESISLIWTPLFEFCDKGEEINGFILNILAPKDSYFFNFTGYYESFYHGLTLSNKNYIKDEKKIKQIIVSSGADTDSFFATILLHGITGHLEKYQKLLGEKYSAYIFLKQSSFFIPTDFKPYVYDYFKQQVIQFDDSSIIKVQEIRKDLDFINHQSFNATDLELIFSSFIDELDNEQQHLLIEKIDILETARNYEGRDIWFLKRKPNIRTIPARNMIFRKHKKMDPYFYELSKKVINFRVDWEIRNYPLKNLCSFKQEINSALWGELEFSTLRNELRRKIDLELAKYPIIQTNPFEYLNSEVY